MHLIIDGYGSNPHILRDEQFLYNLLDRYPAEIGMTKVTSPHVFKYIGTKPEDWGISGIVVIAESHISIHTFVERSYVNIDVFSCKEFDSLKVLTDLQEKFQLTRLRSYLLERGLEYPDQLEPLKTVPILECLGDRR
ncbi:MAG TPA: adenosylmethionine decarboxylase [Dehalococcoidia bacterium]|jgi:S-adenosylmethionine decarboxylase|nr:adenosylmethionine decarboxylase [Dehalococcoidia bacterium]